MRGVIIHLSGGRRGADCGEALGVAFAPPQRERALRDSRPALPDPGDLRRTMETRLADAGVSCGTRGFLQSHGLGDVHIRHYDHHDTLPETRAALGVLYRLLTGND
ncbi:MAG TPA: hypothetical protein VF292_03220 [Rhodanobacteraceae bacterium]